MMRKDITKMSGTKKIVYKFVEGTNALLANELIYIETYRHKNIFCTTGKEYSIYKKLDEIENEMNDPHFLRIHQSYLVNMDYIKKINSYVMTLTTGEQLSVPKARYPQVKKCYAQYLAMKENEFVENVV